MQLFFFFFGRWPINRLGLLYHHKTGQPHRGMKTIMGGYFYPSPAVPVYLFFLPSTEPPPDVQTATSILCPWFCFNPRALHQESTSVSQLQPVAGLCIHLCLRNCCLFLPPSPPSLSLVAWTCLINSVMALLVSPTLSWSSNEGWVLIKCLRCEQFPSRRAFRSLLVMIGWGQHTEDRTSQNIASVPVETLRE